MNILVRWNRTSGNLEIRVPVLGNRLFCAWWFIHFCWDICQDLAASAVRSSLYKCFSRNYDSVCTKADLKSDFYITVDILLRESHHSGIGWASIPTGINPLWFCLGAIYESGHILSSPCRHSGAIAGFIRCVQSHILAIAKTIVDEVAHFAPDRWSN